MHLLWLYCTHIRSLPCRMSVALTSPLGLSDLRTATGLLDGRNFFRRIRVIIAPAHSHMCVCRVCRLQWTSHLDPCRPPGLPGLKSSFVRTTPQLWALPIASPATPPTPRTCCRLSSCGCCAVRMPPH